MKLGGAVDKEPHGLIATWPYGLYVFHFAEGMHHYLCRVGRNNSLPAQLNKNPFNRGG